MLTLSIYSGHETVICSFSTEPLIVAPKLRTLGGLIGQTDLRPAERCYLTRYTTRLDAVRRLLLLPKLALSTIFRRLGRKRLRPRRPSMESTRGSDVPSASTTRCFCKATVSSIPTSATAFVGTMAAPARTSRCVATRCARRTSRILIDLTQPIVR